MEIMGASMTPAQRGVLDWLTWNNVGSMMFDGAWIWRDDIWSNATLAADVWAWLRGRGDRARGDILSARDPA